MRLLFLLLFVLTALIQYPLWLGKGGWRSVWDMQKQVAQQHAANDSMRARNAAMEAEVQSLQNGTDAIEERARTELGMMRPGEVFVEMLPPGTPAPNTATAAVANATAAQEAQTKAAHAKQGVDVTPFLDEATPDGTFLYPVTTHGSEVLSIINPALDKIFLGTDPIAPILKDANDQIKALY